MKRVICWVLGHKWEAKSWQTWYHHETTRDFGTYDQCSRCGKVVNKKQGKITIKDLISLPKDSLTTIYKKID